MKLSCFYGLVTQDISYESNHVCSIAACVVATSGYVIWKPRLSSLFETLPLKPMHELLAFETSQSTDTAHERIWQHQCRARTEFESLRTIPFGAEALGLLRHHRAARVEHGALSLGLGAVTEVRPQEGQDYWAFLRPTWRNST